jgi:hypothetical protein
MQTKTMCGNQPRLELCKLEDGSQRTKIRANWTLALILAFVRMQVNHNQRQPLIAIGKITPTTFDRQIVNVNSIKNWLEKCARLVADLRQAERSKEPTQLGIENVIKEVCEKASRGLQEQGVFLRNRDRHISPAHLNFMQPLEALFEIEESGLVVRLPDNLHELFDFESRVWKKVPLNGDWYQFVLTRPLDETAAMRWGLGAWNQDLIVKEPLNYFEFAVWARCHGVSPKELDDFAISSRNLDSSQLGLLRRLLQFVWHEESEQQQADHRQAWEGFLARRKLQSQSPEPSVVVQNIATSLDINGEWEVETHEDEGCIQSEYDQFIHAFRAPWRGRAILADLGDGKFETSGQTLHRVAGNGYSLKPTGFRLSGQFKSVPCVGPNGDFGTKWIASGSYQFTVAIPDSPAGATSLPDSVLATFSSEGFFVLEWSPETPDILSGYYLGSETPRSNPLMKGTIRCVRKC